MSPCASAPLPPEEGGKDSLVGRLQRWAVDLALEHRYLWCNMTTSIARSCPYDRREPDQLEDATERPVEE